MWAELRLSRALRSATEQGLEVEPGRGGGWGPRGGGAIRNFGRIEVGGRSKPDPGRGSHIEAQVLLFLEEVVEDEFAHEVWVQRVVDHLGPSELNGERRVSARPVRGQVIPRGGSGLARGSRTYLPPLLAGPALRVEHHHCRRERGRGGKDFRSARTPSPPLSLSRTPSSLPPGPGAAYWGRTWRRCRGPAGS